MTRVLALTAWAALICFGLAALAWLADNVGADPRRPYATPDHGLGRAEGHAPTLLPLDADNDEPESLFVPRRVETTPTDGTHCQLCQDSRMVGAWRTCPWCGATNPALAEIARGVAS